MIGASTCRSRYADLDDVAVLEAQRLGRRLRDHRGVVPGQLRDRVRQLLQPDAVGEAAVVHLRIAGERDLHPLLRRPPSPAPTACASAAPSTARPVSTAAAVPGTMPSASQRSQLPSKSPGALPCACQNFLQQRVRADVALADERGQHVGLLDAAPERRDQRLHDRHRSVGGAQVAPRLQRVGRGDDRLAGGGRLVLVERVIDRVRDALEQLAELEVDGRAVDRVRRRDDQRVDAARRRCPATSAPSGAAPAVASVVSGAPYSTVLPTLPSA